MSRAALAAVVVSAVIAAIFGLPPAAGAQELGLEAAPLLEAPAGEPLTGERLDKRTEEVSSLMRCPVCQGLSVADSPTDSAQAMKAEARALLAAGYSGEQVLSYFERSYGEFIRLEPKPRGFNLFVWLAPLLAIVAGLALVLWRVRRGPTEATAPAADPELEAYRERVRSELGR